MHFVAPVPTPKGLARRVPPAIFPPLMGILGLGLAFRQAAWHWPALAPVSELVLGAGTCLALVALCAYGLKVARRPGVVAEEIGVLPGRLGLSALAVCLYLLAAAVGSFLPRTGWLFLGLGLGVQAVLIRRWPCSSCASRLRRGGGRRRGSFTSPRPLSRRWRRSRRARCRWRRCWRRGALHRRG